MAGDMDFIDELAECEEDGVRVDVAGEEDDDDDEDRDDEDDSSSSFMISEFGEETLLDMTANEVSVSSLSFFTVMIHSSDLFKSSLRLSSSLTNLDLFSVSSCLVVALAGFSSILIIFYSQLLFLD